MAVSDTVADFLTRIRNALKAEHRFVEMDWSKMREGLAEIMKEKGFIEDYLIKKDNAHRGKMRLFLRYGAGRKSVIQGLKRVSKPGCRQYVACTDIPRFYGGMGLSILSTSQGVLPDCEARKRKIGGELICCIW